MFEEKYLSHSCQGGEQQVLMAPDHPAVFLVRFVPASFFCIATVLARLFRSESFAAYRDLRTVSWPFQLL